MPAVWSNRHHTPALEIKRPAKAVPRTEAGLGGNDDKGIITPRGKFIRDDGSRRNTPGGNRGVCSTVTLRGKSIRLSPLEYEVLQVLARAAPQMVSYQDLLEAVWGYGSGDKRNYLKLYIRYLRVKLEEDPASPKLIINERGKGYRLAV